MKLVLFFVALFFLSAVSAYDFSPFENNHVSAFVGNGSCGDFVCSSLESCSTCSADCGSCGGGTPGGGSGGGSGGGGVYARSYPNPNASSISYYGLENFWLLTKKIPEEELDSGTKENLFPRQRALVIYEDKSAYLGVVEIISEDLVLLDLKGVGTREFNIGDVINFEGLDATLVSVNQDGLEIEFIIRREKMINYKIVFFILLAVLIILIYFYVKVYLKSTLSIQKARNKTQSFSDRKDISKLFRKRKKRS